MIGEEIELGLELRLELELGTRSCSTCSGKDGSTLLVRVHGRARVIVREEISRVGSN